MTAAARAAVLAGPVVVAFFTGGFTDVPRALAGLGYWLLVLAGLLAGRRLPGGRPAVLALGGLAAFAGWTLLSILWAPQAGPAWEAAQVAFLYVGALAAAALWLDAREAEPALAAGAFVVVGYGLSERLLPGIFDFTQSISAQGRLEQPLTYWNGMGVVAAMGVVACARLAGDAARAPSTRGLAAAGAVPLVLGLALTVSRGALFACVAGLLVLVVAVRRREQLLAVGVIVAAGAAAAGVAAPFDGVTALLGSGRAAQGAVVSVALVVLAAAAAAAVRAFWRPAPLRLPARAGAIALALTAAGLGAVVLAGSETRSVRLGSDASRLVSVQSNRYEYWRVAARAFADQPLRGEGAGAWAVRWRRERPFRESARDAHSLPMQTAAELGLAGLLLLGVCVAGIVLAARAGPPGLAAVTAVYGAHTLLDWDFQLPATTLPAVVAAGALLAYNASATRGASRANTHAASTQTPT